MPIPPFAVWMLEQEARAMLTRLARVKPFVMQESMLPAADLLPESQSAIESYLAGGRRNLRALVDEFLGWLRSPHSLRANGEQAYRRFTMLRLQFNAVLTQFDLFNNVITQRSENETGVWLSGMDIAAADALQLRQSYFEPPPVICYLDRGMGAAIRRARTRLPGGGKNPVAIVKMARERMVGYGIASSLFHEVGHQAAALLDLVESFRAALRAAGRARPHEEDAWRLWGRWISEIIADFWAIAWSGVASTMGLIGTVSLPRAFVFRINEDDPHPAPWIRVKLSAAIGDALFPQPIWRQLTDMWDACYPLEDVGDDRTRLLQLLERTLPRMVHLLLEHRPVSLRGSSIPETLDVNERQPARLRMFLARWREMPRDMYLARPVLCFAVIGQARADGRINPEEESEIIGKLLTYWALRSTLQAAAGCARRPPASCACREAA
jgi:hypothetical protein